MYTCTHCSPSAKVLCSKTFPPKVFRCWFTTRFIVAHYMTCTVHHPDRRLCYLSGIIPCGGGGGIAVRSTIKWTVDNEILASQILCGGGGQMPLLREA